MEEQVIFLAGTGATLEHFSIDVEACTLARRGAVQLPNKIQYVVAHPERPVIYVGSSSRVGRAMGTDHWASALRFDPAADGFAPLGEHLRLPHRTVHITLDAGGRHLLLAYNKPAGLAAVAIEADGSLGQFVPQRDDLDVGIFPHQVRVAPDDRHAICVARGNPPAKGWWAAKGDQVDPGGLKVFRYEDGTFAPQATVTVDDGRRFGPRHLDFHPGGRWVYLSLETQNEAVVLEYDGRGLRPEPLQRLSTLAFPDTLLHQGAGTVHVHPGGHAVYFCNRGHQTMPGEDGRSILTDVENSIVAYAIDADTGLLTEIQRIDSGGICPRTFSLDPSGRMLVAANSETHWVRRNGELQRVPASLATFAVAPDGRLSHRQTYPVELEEHEEICWSGMVAVA